MSTQTSHADVLERFEARTYSDAAGEKLLYRFLMPKNYDAKKRYPLVLFLHGAGERGADNFVQLKHGMAEYASDAMMEKYPCFVMAPQCPTGQKWVDVDWSTPKHDMPDQPAPALRLTLEAIAGMQKALSIDPDRLYVTGLSMGGYGSWDAIQRYPNLFAAAVPICGGGDPKHATKFVHVPVWAFHGDQDTAVKVERSRDMIAALKAAGGSPKYTEYPGVGHDSWTATYRDPAMHEWLFAQRRQAMKSATVEEGFTSLFDGKTLTGWQGSVNGYVVENGAIVCKKDGGGFLYTDKEYADFVIRLEFKLTPGANNGLGIRTPMGGDPAYVGMELQVLDDTAAVYKNLQPYQYHGSIYGVVASKRGHLKPVGEWNVQEVTCHGKHVVIKLNGETIVDADIEKASTPKTIDGKDHPGLKRDKGYICFCGHGAHVEFRNIRLKEIK